MATGNSVYDEIKEQHQKTKDMNFKGKLSYFWDYYKIHTIVVVCVIIFAVSFIHQIGENKPYAFYAVLLNAVSDGQNTQTSLLWENEFQEISEINPEAYQVCIDTSLSFLASSDVQYEAAGRQKLAAMMHSGDIHAIVTDSETFEGYARVEFFYDLSEFFTEEELAPYADLLYYTDAAAYDEDPETSLEEMEASQAAYYAKVIDHGDPSLMEKPVAVGIRIPASGNKLADSGYYRYLQEGDYSFQGYPSETVFGIPLSSKDPYLALQFLSYLLQ